MPKWFAFRAKANGMYFRQVITGAQNSVAVADIPLSNIGMVGYILRFSNLWEATKFIEQPHLRDQQEVELVELELREVRVFPPVMNVQPIEPTEAIVPCS